MSTSKTTTKLGLPLPQPGDKPDWYDLGALCQLLENLFGAVNGFATLDKDGNAVQMPAGAVPNTRKIAGLAMSADITLAQLIAAGLCSAPESGEWQPELYGTTTAGNPVYKVRVGVWEKLGNWCHVYCDLELTSLGGAAGEPRISGVPFVSSNMEAIQVSSIMGTSGLDAPINPFITGSQIYLISQIKSGNSTWELSCANLTDNFLIKLNGVYRIA